MHLQKNKRVKNIVLLSTFNIESFTVNCQHRKFYQKTFYIFLWGRIKHNLKERKNTKKIFFIKTQNK